MRGQAPIGSDAKALIDEIRRYLAAVDAFRAEGREPHWQAELDLPKPRRRARPLVRG
jgi:hypothetical protein